MSETSTNNNNTTSTTTTTNQTSENRSATLTRSYSTNNIFDSDLIVGSNNQSDMTNYSSQNKN